MNKPVKYSIIVTIPGTPDVDTTGYGQLHLIIVVRDLECLRDFKVPQLLGPGSNRVHSGNVDLFPYHVIDYFRGVEEAGNLRAEIIEDIISYKLYIKSEAE